MIFRTQIYLEYPDPFSYLIIRKGLLIPAEFVRSKALSSQFNTRTTVAMCGFGNGVTAIMTTIDFCVYDRLNSHHIVDNVNVSAGHALQ
jgi:hypothetical protein